MKSLTFEEVISYDFGLIGIHCHMKDFRLCWEMNQALSVDLIREEDYKLYDKDSTERSFPFFEFIDEENGIEYYLIKNRGSSGSIIPEEEKVDYLLILKGQVDDDLINSVCEQLQMIDIVLTAYPVEVQSLKSKHNLIF